jgi:hypothetical protein
MSVKGNCSVVVLLPDSFLINLHIDFNLFSDMINKLLSYLFLVSLITFLSMVQ